MKANHSIVWLTALGLVSLAAPLHAQESPVLQTQKDKLSYSFGVEMARNFARQEVAVDVDLLVRGLKDGLSGGKILISQKELRATMNEFQMQLQRKQAQDLRLASEANQKKGEAFLAQNKIRKDVVALPSGLQFEVLKPGAGRKPAATDRVEIIYRGTLLDGTEFDSSEGQAASFPLKGAGILPGWSEALQLMPVGSKWKIFLPPTLAYGPRGAGRGVGPNETGIFELELLSIK